MKPLGQTPRNETTLSHEGPQSWALFEGTRGSAGLFSPLPCGGCAGAAGPPGARGAQGRAPSRHAGRARGGAHGPERDAHASPVLLREPQLRGRAGARPACEGPPLRPPRAAAPREGEARVTPGQGAGRGRGLPRAGCRAPPQVSSGPRGGRGPRARGRGLLPRRLRSAARARRPGRRTSGPRAAGQPSAGRWLPAAPAGAGCPVPGAQAPRAEQRAASTGAGGGRPGPDAAGATRGKRFRVARGAAARAVLGAEGAGSGAGRGGRPARRRPQPPDRSFRFARNRRGFSLVLHKTEAGCWARRTCK